MNNAVTKYLAEIGRKGGKVGGLSTSSAKAEAARENGKKGGRPKLKK
jgi:general stress protein YciG